MKDEEVTKRVAKVFNGGKYNDQIIVPTKDEHQIDKLIFIDYSKPSKRKPVNIILNMYSNKIKKKLLNNSIIILSKNKIVNDRVLHINFEKFNDKKYVDIQKTCKILRQYISKNFKKFIKKKYELKNVIVEDPDIEKNIKETSNTIYNSAVIEKHFADRYAPIILALYDFFEFLRSKYYITQEDYDKFIKDCDAIYGAGDTHIDIPYNNFNNDPIIIFLKAIYELYENNSELFSDSTDSEPFIYDKSTKADKLICFQDIDKAVEFVKNHIDKIDLADSFNGIFVNPEYINDVLSQIKDTLIEKRIQIVNKGRKDYRIGKTSYFAIDIEKLKEFVEQCE